MATTPYVGADSEMLGQIIRQAEARLEAQLTAALGADQRAMTFAGLLMAAVGAMLGFSFSRATDPLVAPIIAVSVGLIFAAALAAWSAQPTKWEYVGNVPSAWLSDIEDAVPVHMGMAQMADWYDGMIATNEEAIGHAAFRMRLSMVVALLSLLAGTVGAVWHH